LKCKTGSELAIRYRWRFDYVECEKQKSGKVAASV
jgi:hypothetical protein